MIQKATFKLCAFCVIIVVWTTTADLNEPRTRHDVEMLQHDAGTWFSAYDEFNI